MEEKESNGREKNWAKGQLDSIPFIDFLLNKLKKEKKKKCAQEESSTEKQQKEEKNDSEQQKN